MDNEKIEDLVHYYDQFHTEMGRPKRTSIGCYQPTDLHDVKTLFDQLIADQFLDARDVFVDTGGGDGRIAALASLYGVHAISIEADSRMHQKATRRVAALEAYGILPYAKGRTNLFCVQGNFLETKTYTRGLSISPRLVDIVFNANSNEAALSQFISQHMKNEVYVVVMQSFGERIHGLSRYATYRDGTGRYLATMFKKEKYQLRQS